MSYDPFEPRPLPDGLAADEAEALLAELLQGAELRSEPLAVSMAGGVAAGKSTALAFLQKSGRVPQGAVLHDPDGVMHRLRGYAELPDRVLAFRRFEPAARWIAEEALRRAVQRRAHVVLDRGLLTPESPALVSGLVSRGYRVVVYHVPCDLELALARARAREQLTGRHVPEAEIRARHAREQALLTRYADVAHELFEIDAALAIRRLTR